MKNGLAIWHYGHRTPVQNAEFFTKNGFDSVSMLGDHMYKVCKDEGEGRALGELIKKSGVVLTVHAKLPASAEDKDILAFKEDIDLVGKWQKRYGGVSILSFDVSGFCRKNGVVEYIDYVLDTVPDCKVALEDYGLTEAERAQTKLLTQKTDRFGYLLDIGHMLIRLIGKFEGASTLFSNSPFECEASDSPDRNAFLKAFRSKDAPVFEMHLHNNDGLRDLHSFLDVGVLNIDELAAAICEFGFDGVITIESAPGYTFKCFGKDADDGIMKTFEYWKAAYNRAKA